MRDKQEKVKDSGTEENMLRLLAMLPSPLYLLEHMCYNRKQELTELGAKGFYLQGSLTDK